MTIRLYNTLTRSSEVLTPLEPGHVRMYLCGLTTYDHAHAGHARTNVSFDVLVRHMRARGLRVTFVRNVTDVDDKIVKRAAELGEAPLELSARMNSICRAELASVGCGLPDAEPKVSESIGDIVSVIEKLISKGQAYAAETAKGRDVYFRVSSFADYGKLSGRKLDELKEGARVEVGEFKEQAADFALWKGCGEGEWGFESPWGKGRPGWHIECSAMAHTHLGAEFDIHAGGMDLMFPHHENEIAQSEGAFGGQLARIWCHAGFLDVDGEKMSKSLGNFVTIKQVLERNDAEAFRLFLLGAHYRGPLNFDVETDESRGFKRVYFPGVDECEKRVEYMYMVVAQLLAAAGSAKPEILPRIVKQELGFKKLMDGLQERVLAELDQDLNTVGAIREIGEAVKAASELLVKELKQYKKDDGVRAELPAAYGYAAQKIRAAAAALGLLQDGPGAFEARTQTKRLANRQLDAATLSAKVDERKAARDAKDFARADAVRAELEAMGVDLFDGPNGTTWRVQA